MKTFDTIRDVIDNAIEMHRQAVRQFRHIDQRIDDARKKMLLDYLVRHHDYLKDALHKRKASVTDTVLDTYIQFTLEETPKPLLENLVDTYKDVSLQSLSDLAQALDEYTVSLFEEALREMDSTTAGDLVNDLMELEALERRKLSQTLSDLLDL